MENVFDCPECKDSIHEDAYLDEEGVCRNCYDTTVSSYESDVDTETFNIIG